MTVAENLVGVPTAVGAEEGDKDMAGTEVVMDMDEGEVTEMVVKMIAILNNGYKEGVDMNVKVDMKYLTKINFSTFLICDSCYFHCHLDFQYSHVLNSSVPSLSSSWHWDPILHPYIQPVTLQTVTENKCKLFSILLHLFLICLMKSQCSSLLCIPGDLFKQ